MVCDAVNDLESAMNDSLGFSDRIRPSCTLCDKMAKACVYPSKRMKPGPKMGRVHPMACRMSLADTLHRVPPMQAQAISRSK